MSCDSTPRCTTREEVWKEVKPARFQKYMLFKTSDSMMDHYFDKLLQIAVFDKDTVKNDFLCEEAEKRVDPLVRVCLKFGKTGKVPVKFIKNMASEVTVTKVEQVLPDKKKPEAAK